jgi:mannose-1-phosphate guanylyltransferase/phosphomannomutase
VHLSPNPEKPRFEIVAEADNDERAWQIVSEYTALIQKIIQDSGFGAGRKKDE